MPESTVHLVTGEFPPQFGGVSDYTLSVARGLAAQGEPVHVWCPDTADDGALTVPGVMVHRVAGQWRRADLQRLDQALDAVPAPRRLIVQWVPHAFGQKSLNVGFCAWVRRRALKGDDVDLMVHEAFFAFGEGGWKQNAAAVVHRLMVSLLLNRARRIWVSIPSWESRLRPYCFGRQIAFEWLPVPSNIPRVDDPTATRIARDRIAGPNAAVVGHFGTYDPHVRRALGAFIPALLAQSPQVTMLLMGRDSDAFRAHLVERQPALGDRIVATGRLEVRELSVTLRACDLMVQPYPDGASSRRGTLMAALCHGVPVVTTEGQLSEPLWGASSAVRLVGATDGPALVDATVDLCADPAARRRMGLAGQALYAQRFDITNTIAAFGSERSRSAA